ncbi:MAG: exported protein of unknown function [Candidatus Saccharibacteria bacterium]|nr:exported protein of unknown function [Candidatus Saccharibacteria bacterium]
MLKPGRDPRVKRIPRVGILADFVLKSVRIPTLLNLFTKSANNTLNPAKSTLLCKKAILVIALLLIPGSVLLAGFKAPQTALALTTNKTLNFQGRLLSNTGSLVADGYYNIEFKLYNLTTSTGTPNPGVCTMTPGSTADPGCLWTEVRYDTDGAAPIGSGNDYRVRVTNGYFSVVLGDTNNGGVAFPTTIDWSQQLYLTMRVGGSTQTATPTWDTEMTPRIQTTAVPLAFMANNVNSGNTYAASTDSAAALIKSGNASGTTSNSGALNIRSGDATGTSGNITIDAGTGATKGTISLGATSASSLLLGRAAFTTTNVGNLTVQGGTQTLGTSSVAGILAVSDGSSNFVNITSSGVGSDYTLTLPTSIGSANQCLQNSGTAGILTFATCATGVKLQDAYNASTGGTTPEIILDSATRNGFDIQDQSSGTIGATKGLLSVRAPASASTFGASLFVVQGNGRVGINNGGTTDTTNVSYDLSLGQITSATTARTIGVETQSNSGTGGNGLTISSGAAHATGSGVGGLLTLQAGQGGATGVGGGITLTTGAGGATSGSSGVLTLQSGSVTAGSTAGSIVLDVGASSAGVPDIGIGATSNSVAKTITIGSTTQTGQILLGQSTATGASVSILSSALATAATQTVNIAGGNLSLSGAGKTINLATGSVIAGTTLSVNIANNASAAGTIAVVVGSNGASGHTTLIQGGTSASAITLQTAGGASSAINIGANAVQKTINIGSVGAVIGASAIHIADTSDATTIQSVIIGSNANAAHTTLIQGGSGTAITLTPQTTGTITIGATGGSGIITLGSSTTTQTVNIGAGTGVPTVNIVNGSTTGSSVTIAGQATASGTDTINIATGNTSGTGAKTVNIANGTPAGGVNTVNIGSTALASTLLLQGGTGTGASAAIKLTAASGGDITIGNSSGAGVVNLNSNVTITAGKNITFGASGNFNQSASSGSFSTGTGTATLNGNTTVTGGKSLTVATGSTFTNASSTLFTSIPVSMSAGGNIPSGGSGSTGASTTVDVATTFDITETTGSQTLTLPTPGVATSGRVVYVNNVGSVSFTLYGVVLAAGNSNSYMWNGTGWTSMQGAGVGGSGVNTIGTFSSGTSYANGATITGGNTITLGSASGSTPGLLNGTTQSLDGDKTWTGNTTMTGTLLQKSDSSSAFVLQDSTATYNNLAFDSSTNRLRVYNHGGTRTDYLEMYYDNATSTGIIASSSGTTQIGSGTGSGGNINLLLTNATDQLIACKSSSTSCGTGLTATAAYSTNDFYFRRNVTGTSYALTGNLMTVEDLSTFTSGSSAPNLLYLNQANSSATGNLLLAQTGGATDVFKVSTAGIVTVKAGGTLTSGGALTVSSGGATVLNVDTGGAAALNIAPTNATSIVIGGNTAATLTEKVANSSTAAYNLQTAGGTAFLTLDSTNSRITVGASDTTGTLLILDTKTGSGDPTGVNGGMYYNSNAGRFRCYENGAWADCLGYRHLLTVASDIPSTASVACQNVTALTFSVTSGVVYRYHAHILHTGTATTIGVGYGVSAPASPTLFSQIQNTPSAATTLLTQNINAISTCTASTASFSTTGNIDEVDGVIVPSASGTFQFLFAPETATASGVVIRAGSTLEWW